MKVVFAMRKERIKLRKLSWCWIGLLLIFIFHFVINLKVIKTDTTPFLSESLCIYERSIMCYRTLLPPQGGIYLFNLIGRGFFNQHYPPVFPLSSIPLYFIFGISPDIACMTNTIFLLMLLWSISSIGREFLNGYAGVLAAFLVLAYPNVFGMSRWYMYEFATLALVTLTVLFLIKSKNFSNRIYSLLAGFIATLAILTKLIAIFFIIGPIVFLFFQSEIWRIKKIRHSSEIQSRLLNLTLIFIVILSLVSIWYYLVKANVFLFYADQGIIFRPSEILWGLKWYYNAFLNIQVHWFYSLVFLISGFILLLKKPKQFTFLFIWFLLPFIAVSCFFRGSNVARQSMPALSAVALISSLGIFNIPYRKIKHFIIILVCVVGLAQILFISYCPWAGEIYNQMPPLSKVNRHLYEHQINHIGLLQADRTDWKADQIISILLEDKNIKSREKSALIVYGKGLIAGALRINILTKHLPLCVDYSHDYWGAFSWQKYWTDVKINKWILGYDYILSYEKRVDRVRNSFPNKVYEIFEKNQNLFQEIKNLKMPDGNTLHIYANKKHYSN